jgi:anti-anti-sigma regulatory factor
MTNREFLDLEAPVLPLVAPTRLTSDARLEFRRAALEALETAVRNGASGVELDLGPTVEIDASGLGVLILVQKRARERGLVTRLLHVPSVVEQLLQVTNLAALFDIARIR